MYKRQIIGNALPDFYGGINNTFNWKDFDLSIFFTYSYGAEVLNATKDVYKRQDNASQLYKNYLFNSGNLDVPFKDIKTVYVCLLYTSRCV